MTSAHQMLRLDEILAYLLRKTTTDHARVQLAFPQQKTLLNYSKENIVTLPKLGIC